MLIRRSLPQSLVLPRPRPAPRLALAAALVALLAVLGAAWTARPVAAALPADRIVLSIAQTGPSQCTLRARVTALGKPVHTAVTFTVIAGPDQGLGARRVTNGQGDAVWDSPGVPRRPYPGNVVEATAAGAGNTTVVSNIVRCAQGTVAPAPSDIG
jgi:hypothetical protein